MTSRVSSKITLGNGLGQGRKSQLRARQGSLLGGHITIPKFIGQYQVGFGPYRYHRLIASSFFIVTVGRLLMTLNDRGVLIDSRYPLWLSLLLVQPGNPTHAAALHFLQSRHRHARRKNEALLHLPFRP